MNTAIFYIIIIALLAIITIILCLAFIYALKFSKKISKTTQQFNEKREWISMIVDVLTELIGKVTSIFERKKESKK